MKTESELFELSKQAAEILGRPAFKMVNGWIIAGLPTVKRLLLVDDHGACAEIAADRRMAVDNYSSDKFVFIAAARIQQVIVSIADFPSRINATNFAILTAVVAQHKETS